jgi:hypothetical protein
VFISGRYWGSALKQTGMRAQAETLEKARNMKSDNQHHHQGGCSNRVLYQRRTRPDRKMFDLVNCRHLDHLAFVATLFSFLRRSVKNFLRTFVNKSAIQLKSNE